MTDETVVPIEVVKAKPKKQAKTIVDPIINARATVAKNREALAKAQADYDQAREVVREILEAKESNIDHKKVDREAVKSYQESMLAMRIAAAKKKGQ